MKKNELKELINPIVKECVNENIQAILLESGLLSQVISEVVKGLKPTLIENRVETKLAPKQIDESFEHEENHMREIMKRSKERKNATIQQNSELLNSRMSFKGINIFEGIKDSIPDEPVSSGPGSAMSGIAPDDPGVDISGLFDPRIANALLKGKK
jgi:hypothetical protein